MDREELLRKAQLLQKAKQLQDRMKSGALENYIKDAGAINEQHPDIGFGTRTLLENLGNSPESKAAYLQQQGFEAKPSGSEVLVKKPGEDQWKKLQPSGLDVQDITDSAYNVAAGAASGLAGTAAATVATPATAGIGAIPAAMGASGLTSAAAEALRQKLGSMAGIPQEVSGKDVALSGVGGAAAPLLFGTGVGAKQLLAKGMDTDALKAALENTRAPIARGIEAITPKMGEMIGGVPRAATEAYIENPEVLKNLAGGGANDLAEAAQRKIVGGAEKARQNVGKEMQKAYEQTGLSVDISPVKKEFQDRLAYLQGKPDLTQAEQKEISALESAYNDVFGLAEARQAAPLDQTNMVPQVAQTEISNNVPAQRAFDLQQKLRQLTKFNKDVTPETASIQIPAQRAWGKINEGLDTATAGASSDLKSQYASLKSLEDKLGKYFSDPEKTHKTLTTYSGDSKKWLKNMLKEYESATGGATDLNEMAAQLQAHKYYENPSLTPLSGGGSTSTSRTIGIGAPAAMLGYHVAGYPGAAVGMASGNLLSSPMALKAAINVGRLASKGQKVANPAAIAIWNELLKNQKESP